jgi:hypothetical protein
MREYLTSSHDDGFREKEIEGQIFWDFWDI